MISSAQAVSLTVIVSRGQSRAPDKRALESAIVEAAETLGGIRVLSIPHLYDLPPKGETAARLAGITGDVVVCAWIYPRAARWVLDRLGLSGHAGRVQLVDSELADNASEDGVDANGEASDGGGAEPETNPLTGRVIDQRRLPDRKLYCIDLRAADSASAFVEELERILALTSESPPSDVFDSLTPPEQIEPLKIEEGTTRRWYPVIDFSRCTNCMECIDFCLFGVYGVDGAETILVEQPDNCRKGCPACSRVCPENAIMFPQHKTPAIAGSETDDGTGLKIDLSLLFGAPDKDEDPIAAAARERDEQLLLAGRPAVGMEVGIPRRHQEGARTGPKDDLDHLIDELDQFEL